MFWCFMSEAGLLSMQLAEIMDSISSSAAAICFIAFSLLAMRFIR